MSNKFIVTKPWGKHKKGDILPESRETRRKTAEGGCLEPYEKPKKKMEQTEIKNKMQPDKAANK